MLPSTIVNAFVDSRGLCMQFNLILLLIVVFITSQVRAAPSYYPLGAGYENPVLRQYRLMTMMPAPSSFGVPNSRKATRSGSAPYKTRNCFFSPVQCTLSLSKASLETGSTLRRRRRIFGNGPSAAAPAFDDYSPMSRFRRDWTPITHGSDYDYRM